MSLQFSNISHSYGTSTILDDISLVAEPGEILCLLGASGCGKTTLLNLAAGILALQSGSITLDGDVIGSDTLNLPPEKRPIGLVFQDGALFPHLSIKKNIEFGIAKQAGRDDVTAKLLDQVGLSGLEDRYPHTLSGGQQQRVAVARALAPQPRVLLMDEPFANIDIMLRRRLREDIRHVLKSQNCISIMVTHDPEEAMEVSDKLAIMQKGKIVQSGSPKDIFENPNSLSVAKLTSEGTSIQAEIKDGQIKGEFGAWSTKVLQNDLTVTSNQKFDLFVRPVSINIKPSDNSKPSLTITDLRHTGQAQIVTLETPSQRRLRLHIETGQDWNIGQSVRLEPKAKSLMAFPA